jgi:hypothetical protein
MRGGSVEIPLPVPKGNFNQLVYSIIEEARYGRFSDLTQQIAPSGQRHWQVTYTHGNDNSSVSDRLFFEVSSTPSNNQGHRGQGRKHSRGRGIVYIRVLDAAPWQRAELAGGMVRVRAVLAGTDRDGALCEVTASA